MMRILIRKGEVFTGDGMIRADVLVEDDRVVEVGPGLEAPPGALVVEAGGCWVGPGLVDLHVHLREPGQEWKEDVATGSAAAAAGGFTAVVAMPNTQPPIDSGHLARFVAERGRSAGLVEVIPAGAITLDRSGGRLAHLDELWDAGVRVFTDDGDTVGDAGLLRMAMEYLGERGAVLAEHAEDPGLSRGGHMHEGTVSSRLGINGSPALAEELVVARDLALVRMTSCRYHLQHVSTARSVELVAEAKEEGLPVTAEVTPHHLALTHEAVLAMDPNFKMYPPLRTQSDRLALIDGLREGVLDAVATDHAPHADFENEVPFEEAPRGVIGLETAVAVVLEAVGAKPELLFDRMSVRPARIAGLPRQGIPPAGGTPANLVVIDPVVPWTARHFRSRSQNSPWLGKELAGRPVATIHEGRLTYQIEGAGAR